MGGGGIYEPFLTASFSRVDVNVTQNRLVSWLPDIILKKKHLRTFLLEKV